MLNHPPRDTRRQLLLVTLLNVFFPFPLSFSLLHARTCVLALTHTQLAASARRLLSFSFLQDLRWSLPHLGRALNGSVWHKAVTIALVAASLAHAFTNKLHKFPLVSWKGRAGEMPQLTRLQFWTSASSSFSVFGCGPLSTSHRALTVALPQAHLW